MNEVEIRYIIGDVINGDYEKEYDEYTAAEEAYADYVEDGIKANREADNDMTLEDTEEFFYILKITKEIIVGGTYNTVQM